MDEDDDSSIENIDGKSATDEDVPGSNSAQGSQTSGGSEGAQQSARRYAPEPKLMPADFVLRNLPRREYVLGHRFMAGAVTLGVAPPGTGKSNFSIVTALSIATGEALTGERVHRSGPVWIHNNEDSRNELYRRVGGVLKHHGIEFASAREQLFVTSGLDEPLVVAIKDKDIVRSTIAVGEVIASIKEKGIAHMAIDPFVSTHRGVAENSNEEMERVADAIRHIAHQTGCSIDLIHHSRKPETQNTELHAGDMNAARGAGALIASARIVYTLAIMSKKTGEEFGLAPGEWAGLVRLDQGKGNYSARDPSVRWFELIPVDIGNGVDMGDGIVFDSDTVAVPVRWHPPNDHTRQAPRVDPKEAKRQHVRNIVAAAMTDDRCPVSELINPVKQEFGIEKSSARDLLMDAIAEGTEVAAEVNECHCFLTIERQLPSPPGRLFVIRRWAMPEAKAA